MADAGYEYLALVKRITDAYPAFAPLLSIPDIANLLIEASVPGQQWSPDKLQAKLQGTDWWKNTSESDRNWQITKLTQPGQAAQSSAQIAATILASAGQSGIVLTPQELAAMTENAQADAWTQQQMMANIASHAELKTLRAGTVKNTAAQLGKMANEYGVRVSAAQAFDWSMKVAAGKATVEGFESWTRDLAKRAFPTLAPELDKGFTVRQLAEPYLQTAGQLLGMDPERMDLTKPKWQRALQMPDGKGPMDQLTWQRTVMTSPEYGYERSAHGQSAALELRESLAQTFGVRA